MPNPINPRCGFSPSVYLIVQMQFNPSSRAAEAEVRAGWHLRSEELQISAPALAGTSAIDFLHQKSSVFEPQFPYLYSGDKDVPYSLF